MKILLDTHLLVWFVNDSALLPKKVLAEIRNPDNEIYYSLVSILEVELKHISHPNQISLDGEQLSNLCTAYRFIPLNLERAHIYAMKNLRRRENTPPHKDPFDKLMLSQAIVEDMIFMTHDDRLGEYDTPNIYKV